MNMKKETKEDVEAIIFFVCVVGVLASIAFGFGWK